MTIKSANREKLLAHGLEVVHALGYMGASVRDIVEAAKVPQGSFTNHFTSKEAFGLEILDLYFEARRTLMARTLLDDSQPPLERLERYIDELVAAIADDDMRCGCMLGNMSTDAAQHSEPIRARLTSIFQEVEAGIQHCLRDAQRRKQIPAKLDLPQTASFINSALQGAFMIARVQRTADAVNHFKIALFEGVLRK
jgi:TetR/AcrR family transcriptional repressor of nem operon